MTLAIVFIGSVVLTSAFVLADAIKNQRTEVTYRCRDYPVIPLATADGKTVQTEE